MSEELDRYIIEQFAALQTGDMATLQKATRCDWCLQYNTN